MWRHVKLDPTDFAHWLCPVLSLSKSGYQSCDSHFAPSRNVANRRSVMRNVRTTTARVNSCINCAMRTSEISALRAEAEWRTWSLHGRPLRQVDKSCHWYGCQVTHPVFTGRHRPPKGVDVPEMRGLGDVLSRTAKRRAKSCGALAAHWRPLTTPSRVRRARASA